MQTQPQEILKRLVDRRKWLIWPALIATGCVATYSLLTPKMWTATQTLHVREEGTAAMAGLGRFESVDAMQTAQETLHEVVQHTTVLKKALQDVGPRKSLSESKRAAWPSQRQINDFRGDVYLEAPYGTAFGRTEVIHLTVRARSVERAEKLAEAVYNRLVEGMQELRSEKYESIIAELENGVNVAQTDLKNATRRLRQMEIEIGENLPELRVMMNVGQGDGNVRRSLNQIEAELRVQRAEYVSKFARREQLLEMQSTPSQLISMPIGILDGQPTLRRLRESLVDARVATARLMGVMSAEHPEVRATKAAEIKIQQQLQDELQIASKAIGTDLVITEKRIASIKQQLERVRSQMGELSGVRADYAALVSEVEQLTLVAQNVQADLTKARSSMMAAAGASLLSPVGNPVPSADPISTSGAVLCLIAMVGGLFTGFGLIWIFDPISIDGEPREGRRWSDRFAGFGRRKSDQNETAAGERRDGQASGRREADRLSQFWPPSGSRGDGASSTGPLPNGQDYDHRSRRSADTPEETRSNQPSADAAASENNAAKPIIPTADIPPVDLPNQTS